MKKFILPILIFSLSACGNYAKTGDPATADTPVAPTEVPDMHTAENALDYFGVYEGTLPAASCPGIRTVLTIHKDTTFTLHSEYIDRKDGVFDEKGTYTLQGSLMTLKLGDGEIYYYKVEEGRVRMLNADKEPITGDLAENYVLKQTQIF